MNRTRGKRALMVTVVAWVLLLLLAFASASGVFAALMTYDFRGKVAGSTVKNPHVAYALAAGTPDQSPATIIAQAPEFSQADYDGVEVDDATYASQTATIAWVEVGSGSATGGGISDNGDESRFPSLALDWSGNPYVAWHDESSGDYEIYIKRYDGANWVEVGSGSASGGGISDNSGSELSGGPSLAFDGSGNPYVAWPWHECLYCIDAEIYIKRFDGANWVEVGSGSASGGGISGNTRSVSPSVALDASGTPYVAWTHWTRWEIYIKRFDGANWVEVGSGSASGGGISDDPGESYHPSLAFDGSGTPYVAWYDGHYQGADAEIYIKRFDGANWVEVGSGSASGGGISDNSGASYSPSLALDGSGKPCVAWTDRSSGNNEIYVKRFDGANWVEVGSGSASGGGISDNSGLSYAPSLALDGSGNPYVAWWDNTSGNYEIYIKRFDGANWVEVGSGSASGGGISENGGHSYYPSLALDASGKPYVAWYDDTSGNYEIYIKRFGPGYAEYLYSFHLSEGTINQIVPSVLAYGTAATDGVTAQLWNDAISAWEMVGSNSDSSMPSTPITATFSDTPTNYVDASNKVYLLVRTTYPSDEHTEATLYVDYVRLEVDYDSLPRPSGTISINKGALGTTSADVLLDLWSDSAVYMRFSNDGADYTAWESYAASKSWMLAGGDGEKTVYVEYRDASVASAVYTDTITLDTSVGSEYGASINKGALYTNQISVTLSLGAPAYTAQMKVSNDGGFAGAEWEPFATIKPWVITAYGSQIIPRTVYVRFRDMDGVSSATYTDDIILDTNAPTSEVTRARVTAAGEYLPETSLVPVKVTWTGEDDNSGVKWYGIQYRVDRSGRWTKWFRRTKQTSAIFNARPGHTYYFRSRAQDRAGNWEGYPRGDGDISIDIPATTNALSNGSFEKDGRIPAPWKGKNLTSEDSRVCHTAHHGSCSFRMVGASAKKSLRQVLDISGSAGDILIISGWSRARDPSRTGGPYCLQARVFQTDGTKKTYRTCFAKRTHGWQYRERSFTAAKDYNKIVVFFVYARQSGEAWFDDVKLLVPR